MLGIVSTLLGFTKAHKVMLHVVAIGSLLSLVIFYAVYAGALKDSVRAKDDQIALLRVTVTEQEAELQRRNARIVKANREKMQAVTKKEEELIAARILSRQLMNERDKVTEELAVARFEILEAIRDDEDMADWVDWTVPSAAWRLLEQSTNPRTE